MNNVVEMYKNGMGMKRIAKEVKLSYTQVRNILKKENVVFRAPHKKGVWIKDCEDMIKLYSNGMSIKDISDKFKVHHSSILKILKKREVKIERRYDNVKRVLSKQQVQDMVQLYRNGKTYYELEKIYGISRNSILRHIHCNGGIENRVCTNKKYSYNEKFFDNIDSEEKAYLLGLLYADGNNYRKDKKTYRISISLQARDINILNQMKDVMGYNAPLRLYQPKDIKCQPQYNLKFNGKYLSDSLIKLGVIPRKTYNLNFPTFLNEDLYRHFIRGCIDGDGSVCICKDHYGIKNQGVITLSGTSEICNGFKNYIESIFDIHVGIYNCKSTHIKQASIGGNIQVLKILDWLYKDAKIFINRKYFNYLKLKDIYNAKKAY